MSFKNLQETEKKILQSIITGVGSTSENIAGAFVTGNLAFFEYPYAKFDRAWNRLDDSQKSAVIELREIIDIKKDEKRALSVDSFVGDYIEWLKIQFVLKMEIKYLDNLKGDFCYEDAERHFQENLASKHYKKIENKLKIFL